MAKGLAPAAAIAAWVVASATLLGTKPASAASLVEISGFGQNPTNRNAPHNGMLAPGTNTAFGFQVRRPNGNTQLASGFACSSP